ncbi:MAG: GGDEF domain-containing protein [Arenimonas sp.]
MNAVQSRRLAQEVDDTRRRASVGGLFYLAGWLVVGGYGGAFGRAPVLSWSLAGVFLALALARFAHRPPKRADDSARLRWVYWSWANVLASTLGWSGVFFWAMRDPGFEPARVAAMLATLGLATAFAHTFAFRLGFAALGIALLYLPGLLILWSDASDQATALVTTIYLIYVYLSLLRAHADYQHRLDIDQDLRDQRDLFARQSRVDALTELANRRHFAEVLAGATRQARRHGPPLSLLLLDIDHFKSINDNHGHPVGDGCLSAIASRLQLAFPNPGELAARIGGEEFGVVLEGQSAAAASARAESFRQGLAAKPLLVDGIALPVTISIGWAEFDPAVHGDVDGLFRAADQAVYRAKREGRDRVCGDLPSPVAGADGVVAGGESTSEAKP